MAVETFPATAQRSFFDRTLDVSRINLEIVAYSVLIIASIIAHLWGLGTMAMHHDESIHAWASWKFFTGRGGFTCYGGIASDTYCYDPVYHGPSLYILTLLSYFLFGDGDAQARLPMALAGIGMVASCWMLRPYLGRRGAFIAAVLLGFSPSLLYFTRFARHDGLMVLWELWMVIGIMRYLDTGKPGYLYLLAASLALAIGTHELYYILFFIFGFLVLVRLIAESSLARFLNYAVAAILAISALFIIINPPLPIGEGLYLGEKLFLVATVVLLTWLASRVWTSEPILTHRLATLWREERRTLWIALAILVSLYLVMYTTFFAYPRGAIDGLYAGLAYWLGSQQAYARGDQPWYYYLLQLGIYEPLSIFCGIGAAIYLFSRKLPGLWGSRAQQADETELPLEVLEAGNHREKSPGKRKDGAALETPAEDANVQPAPPAPMRAPAPDSPAGLLPTGNLFPLVLVVWFFSAVVIFSWAGEKMPWLVVHMSLPGNLLVAWVLAQLIGVLPQRGQAAAPEGEDEQRRPMWRTWLVPPVLLTLLITLGVALWRLYSPAEGQIAQSNMLQSIVPLIIFGVMIYVLLTLSQHIGGRVVLALCALTFAALLGAYMIRSTWLAVYHHPDVPIELLVYTQTSPDVPRYVEEIRELAINQTRNHRTAEDVAGGLSMPVVISNGDENGAGSLAWPLQWYFRDFQNLVWKSAADIREPTQQTFEVGLPGGETGLAPVLMLFRPHVTETTRSFLEEHYVQPYGEGAVFNWWFPEGDKCSPDSPGYKRFYFNAWASRDDVYEEPPRGCANAPDIVNELPSPLAPLIWPLQPQNWEALRNFLLYRELPSPLSPGSRDMEVWLRSDLVSGFPASSSGGSTGAARLPLLAEQQFGQPGDLAGPTGVAVDSEGRVYVADTQNHRVQVFDSNGDLLRTIGEFGSGEEQFNEPRGLVVDDDGNLYVADTWNARIVKIGPSGRWLTTWGSGNQDMGGGRVATITDGSLEQNQANPLGFFGPRGLALDAEGNVYISDTGNKRIVVTDNEGEYLYQWGAAGSGPGQFDEPTAVGVDANGRVYVADTWNSRVQVFAPGANDEADDAIDPEPIFTWTVNGWEPGSYQDPSLAVSPGGQVYVSVPGRNLVAAHTTEGQTVLRWGGQGDDMASLNAPSGISVGPDGEVYVVDRLTGRVLQFRLPRLLPPPANE